MVFQNYALYPHMTVFDNMAFGLKLRKFPREEIRSRVHAAAEILGLQDYLERLPKALSGGQRQRVAVGRAIVRQPAVFLFDEPLSNLDAKMRVQMRGEIRRLHRRLDATMIYVTHDQVEAMTMGDRICVMKDGHIQQVAEPLELYNDPVNRFVAGFIGTPPMSFVDGELRQDDGAWHFAAPGIRLPLPAAHLRSPQPGPVAFGIRPEDLGSEGVEAMPGLPRIAAVVENLEPMGSETYAQLAIPGGMLVARFPASRRVGIGESVEVAVNMARSRFFAPGGDRLR
jgi:multiple sugar transport system ATP-binding protein